MMKDAIFYVKCHFLLPNSIKPLPVNNTAVLFLCNISKNNATCILEPKLVAARFYTLKPQSIVPNKWQAKLIVRRWEAE